MNLVNKIIRQDLLYGIITECGKKKWIGIALLAALIIPFPYSICSSCGTWTGPFILLISLSGFLVFAPQIIIPLSFLFIIYLGATYAALTVGFGSTKNALAGTILAAAFIALTVGIAFLIS